MIFIFPEDFKLILFSHRTLSKHSQGVYIKSFIQNKNYKNYFKLLFCQKLASSIKPWVLNFFLMSLVVNIVKTWVYLSSIFFINWFWILKVALIIWILVFTIWFFFHFWMSFFSLWFLIVFMHFYVNSLKPIFWLIKGRLLLIL